MSRLEKKQREAERAARRAARLADRADQRAQRKGEQAQETADRAERLAERANQRQGSRARNIEDSIEDYVDEVADKWIRKTESWIDDKSRKLFDSDQEIEGKSTAAVEARKARLEAEAARKAAEKAMAYARQSAEQEADDEVPPRYDEELRSSGTFGNSSGNGSGRDRGRSRSRTSARRHHRRGSIFSRRSRRRHSNRPWFKGSGRALYRDKQNGKLCGVCAGLADYLNMDTWVVRAMAIFGVMFMSQIVIPGYFILYFVLDDKPLYLKVTDKYDDVVDSFEAKDGAKKKGEQKRQRDDFDITATMGLAKQKFSAIEQRLRLMERYVTSSSFQLHREFNKMAREEPKGAA